MWYLFIVLLVRGKYKNSFSYNKNVFIPNGISLIIFLANLQITVVERLRTFISGWFIAHPVE